MKVNITLSIEHGLKEWVLNNVDNVSGFLEYCIMDRMKDYVSVDNIKKFDNNFYVIKSKKELESEEK